MMQPVKKIKRGGERLPMVLLSLRRSRRFLPGVVSATLLVLITVGSALAGRSGPAPTPEMAPAPVTIRVTVRPGDTLWSLARQYGDDNRSILDRVDAMAEANGLTSDKRIYPGHRILVQVENPVELARLEREERANRARVASVR